MTGFSGPDVEVKLADGRRGVIARSEFAEPPTVGSAVTAALLARDDPAGRVWLSHSWAVRQVAWDRLEAAHAEGATVPAAVIKVVRGGLLVDVGLRAFLPASMVSDEPVEDLTTMVGRTIDVLVAELDRDADRLVVSRRELVRRARRQSEKEIFAEAVPGSRVRVSVVSVAPYGLHVTLGGVRGLIHRSELAWGREPSPGKVAAVGDELDVVVLSADRQKRRLSLSLRQTTPDPLAAIEVGSVVSATITRIVDYGVFARLDDAGVVGLAHLSELSDLPGVRPDQVVTVGEAVQVRVLGVDHAKRRVGLSIRQAVWP